MTALKSITTEATTRIKALAPEPGQHLRGHDRFTETNRQPLEEQAGRSRLFEVVLDIDRHDDTLTTGPDRWYAEGAVRVRYESGGPAVRAMAREAANRDAQRITAVLRNPAGWPEAYNVRVRANGLQIDDYVSEGGKAVAVILEVYFTASFTEEVG